jgi:dolichol-phosphate mannosyltransferase
VKILVGIPILNELGNIEPLIPELLDLDDRISILIIDDSPISSELKIMEGDFPKDRFFFRHRSKRLGVGSAHQEIISFGTSNDFDCVVTMDGDGTHSSRDIPKLIQAIKYSDLVIGSRFISGGDLRDWTFIRRLTTNTAHIITKFATHTSLDCTSGIRAYNLKNTDYEKLLKELPSDYRFFYSSTFRLLAHNLEIQQVPVILESRNLGKSKMSLKLATKLIISLFFGSLGYMVKLSKK